MEVYIMETQIFGIDTGIVGFLLTLIATAVIFFLAIESWDRGKRIKRQKDNYKLAQNKEIIIIATYLRSGNITPSSHFDGLTKIVGTTASFNDNLGEAKKITDQFKIRMKLISQLKKIADELQAKNDPVLFDSLSKRGEESFGSLEAYGISSTEDVQELYDWFSQAYYLEKKE